MYCNCFLPKKESKTLNRYFDKSLYLSDEIEFSALTFFKIGLVESIFKSNCVVLVLQKSNMTRLFFMLIIMVLTQFATKAQPRKEIKQILKKVNNQLNSCNAWSYYQKRETRYYGDNYHNIMHAKIYFEKDALSPIGFKFSATDTARKLRFLTNGKNEFFFRENEKTIDSTSVTMDKLNSNSFLYHSFLMLKNTLPWLITFDSMNLQMRDTVINTKAYYKISFWNDSLYLGLFKGTRSYDNARLQLLYHLLIDKKTYLPYQLLFQYKRGADRIDDKDFVAVTYLEIQKQTKGIDKSYWQYATYAKKYSPYIEKPRFTRIKPGSQLANFKLPMFMHNGIDTVTFNSFKGKIVLLDFWFKACGPCMEAMPHFNELQTKFEGHPFQLVSINVEDGVDDIKFFYNKLKPVYPMLFMGKGFFNKMGYYACPTSMLIAADGKIIKIREGFDKELTEKDIEEALKSNKN